MLQNVTKTGSIWKRMNKDFPLLPGFTHQMEAYFS